MAHKHNRRRIRPRSRNHASSSISVDGILSSPGLTEVAPPVAPRNNTANSKRALVPKYNRLTDLTAQHWHNRYISWQARERQQRQEQEAARAKMEADQCRLFGGEPGDDVSLCYKMLEYFGGLDYIDS